MTNLALGIDPSVRASGVVLLEMHRKPRVVFTATLHAKVPEQAIHELVECMRELPTPDVTGIEAVARAAFGKAQRKETTFAASFIREVSGSAYGAARALKMAPMFVQPEGWRSGLGLRAKASKADVRRAVMARVDFEFEEDADGLSEHEADAIAIALRANAQDRLRGVDWRLG